MIAVSLRKNLVELHFPEVLCGAIVGVLRQIASIDSIDRVEEISKAWGTSIDGALREPAFAKFMNLYWPMSVNAGKAPDVSDWQVRGTNWASGHLILRPATEKYAEDPSDYRYAFVCGRLKGYKGKWMYDVVGWFWGSEAKQQKYWEEKEKSWWVPWQDLHSLKTLDLKPQLDKVEEEPPF